jgi:cytochrome c553
MAHGLFRPALMVSFLLGGCGIADSRSADRFTANGEVIAMSGGGAGATNACFTCHGLAGRGDGAGVPRLAGLPLGYLNAQMEDYAAGLRQHARMQYIGRKLSPRDRQAVAAYYAAMPFEHSASSTIPASQLGARIYRRGDPPRGLQACVDCHGVRGEGNGAANPPLGAQPGAYLAQQIDLWRLGKRRNDPDNLMLRISRKMSPSEAAAVSAYAGALPGSPPSPGSPEAFPTAHRGDPRSDVSGQRPHEAAQ